MNKSTKGLFLILIIAMSFVAVQSVCAESITGEIDSISYRPPKVVIGDTEISGVRINYLANQYNIFLEQGDTVTIEYYEYECNDGSIILKACEITVGDATIALRPCL